MNLNSIKISVLLLICVIGNSCQSKGQEQNQSGHLAKEFGDHPVKMKWSEWQSPSEEDWKEKLTQEEYRILRKEGTERAFSGELWDNKDKGVYSCAGCGLPLFHSKDKFSSGTGWPSFTMPIKKGVIRYISDTSYGMQRVEVECGRCGGHQGHVFRDGPQPTGLRYCINSISLQFEEEE